MRVITFSRYFPKGHPKEGQPTYFVEKMLRGYLMRDTPITLSSEFLDFGYLDKVTGIVPIAEFQPKWHTIRAGNRWKVGDLYAPRIWSGKPYASKQISFLPPVKICKIWDITIETTQSSGRGFQTLIEINGKATVAPMETYEAIARNDGLELNDFLYWFNAHPKKKEQYFTGQILCHNPEITY